MEPRTCHATIQVTDAEGQIAYPPEERFCGLVVAEDDPTFSWETNVFLAYRTPPPFTAEEKELGAFYCPSCLGDEIRDARDREEQRRKTHRRDRCRQALLKCVDDEIILAVEAQKGHFPSALQRLVPPDIPLLGDYYQPLDAEIKRRGLLPVLHLARLRERIKALQGELDQALGELPFLEAQVSNIKKRGSE